MGRGSDYIHELGERIDRLNKIPIGPGVIVAISLASFFSYYDVTNYAYISPVLRNVWGVTDADIAAGASMTVLGYVAGAIGITILADLKGRKIAFIASILLLGAGSILAAASQDMNQLIMFRFITGAGIGSEFAIASVYISEMSPKSKRGRYTSFLTVLGWTGLTASGPISLFLIQEQFLGIDGWRIVLGIAGAVALASLPFRVRMPESLRWLLSRGRLDETNRILKSIGSEPLQLTELDERKGHDFRFLKDKKVLLRILLLGIVWFLILIPIYASLLLVVEFVNQGYTVTESISINILSAIGFVAGGVLAIVVAEKIERKHQIAIASFGMSIGFILRGFLVHDYGGLVFAGFVAFFANAWLITSLLAYTAENFPTRIRSSATGIVEGSSRGIAAIAPFIFVMLQPQGFMIVMAGIAIFSFIASGVILAFGRKTRDQSLEKLTEQ
ncbi:MAG TPA: MFS transporter [Nitrososphaera sp.]